MRAIYLAGLITILIALRFGLLIWAGVRHRNMKRDEAAGEFDLKYAYGDLNARGIRPPYSQQELDDAVARVKAWRRSGRWYRPRKFPDLPIGR